MDPVEQFSLYRVKEEAVYSEVAPLSIGHGVAENHAFGTASVLIIGFGAEGSDLKLFILLQNDNHTELASYGNASGKKFLDLVRQRGSGDVVIRRTAAELIVPNAPTHPEGRKACCLKAFDNGKSHVSEVIGLLGAHVTVMR